MTSLRFTDISDIRIFRRRPDKSGKWEEMVGMRYLEGLSEHAVETLDDMLRWFEPRPLAALCALLRGETETGASAAAGVSIEDLERWRRDEPDFGVAWDRCWTWGPMAALERREQELINDPERSPGAALTNRMKKVDPSRRKVDSAKAPNPRKRGLGLVGVQELKPPA